MSKNHTMDMCNGPILKKMLIFALPLMLSSILQLLFNAADIVVVGRFAGDNYLAAVGSTSSLINLLVNLFMGLSIGTNVLVARYFAGKEDEQLSLTIHTSISISIVSGVILTLLGVFLAPYVLKLMQTPPEVIEHATIYLRIYFLGMTATMLYNFGAAILRAIGDTKRPLYYLFFSGIINVVLNLFFVIVLDLNVKGVALATVISQTISAALIIKCLLKEKGGIKLIPNKLKIDKIKLLQIMQIGVPAGLQGIIFSISNVVVQSSINIFGATIVAGNSAALNIEGFIFVAMNSFYQANISFTSQNVGAGKYERINKILFTALGCVTVVGLLFGNIVLLFARQLLGIYSTSPEVINAGIDRLKIICITYFLCGTMDVTVGSLRGLGYAVTPMIVSLIGVCALRLIWIGTFFQMEIFHNVETIYITYPVSWFITFVAHIICYIIIRKKMSKSGAKGV